MSPEATYNFRPTYYYNVWSVDLQEYREPKAVDFEHKLSLATQMYSVQAEDVVWAIESNSDIIEAFDDGRDYSVYIKEAKVYFSTWNLRDDGGSSVNNWGPVFVSADISADTDYILTLPCDSPMLADDFVDRFIEAQQNSNARVCVAHDGERLQPVYALFFVG